MTTRTTSPPLPVPPRRDGPLDVLADVLRVVSRVCAVPAGLLALAAFAAFFAPTVPLSGTVTEVRETESSRGGVTREVVVSTASGTARADIDRSLMQAVQEGDSAVVQATPLFRFAHSVTVYRDGTEIGASTKSAWFAWAMPLFVLAIAAYTLSWWHSSDTFGPVLAAAVFNVGVTVAAAVLAYRAFGR